MQNRIQNLINDTLVVIFAVDETTVQLSKYCFEKIGFPNVVLIEGSDGFTDKFIKFADIVADSDYEYYIRSDSDRLVFSGMIDLLEEHNNHKDIEVSEGIGFDYFMNNFRGATPHVFKRRSLEMLHKDNSLIKNLHKPENYFVKSNNFSFLSKDILTNLHDFGQRPSKACNAFLNRLLRDNPPLRLYNMDYLKTLPEFYIRALQHPLDQYKNIDKKNMDYVDFSFLDEGFEDHINKDLDKSFDEYQNIYNSVKERMK